MGDGKVNKALKLSEISNKGGILPLTDETFEVLLGKHPETSKAFNNILTEKEFQNIHPVIYDSIDSAMVGDAIKKTRGSTNPSGLDVDGWRRILISGNFGTSREHLRKAITDMTKRLCQGNQVKHLETCLACRLIPLVQTTWSLTYWNRRRFETYYWKSNYEIFKKRCSKSHWIFPTLRRIRCRQ